ncbi:disintegrin and metalloproteinase domain-containing protein 1-like [Dasypus novemcinctus]|uniref:disintegrin and metalloproteinase domain-containing protein 1-like n=1 Tax=Dasypus novemcinctus TaxID=9361 RepID=UPI00265E9407|nr:disintegrin and metalloproteinase domain-containing protein 1-like [Dasypus novemcinctus]
MAALLTDCVSIRPSLQKNEMTLEEGKVKFQTWAPYRRDPRLGPVPEPSCVSMTVLALVLVFLPSTCCDLASGDDSFYEIIIPKRLRVEGGDDPVDKASYALIMQGQEQVLHLTVKKDYFVSNFPVYSYHNGILGQETPFISRDCHFEGYIEGVPGSFVSVNTCSGLKGILIKEEKSYGIEPMDSSKGFEHVLYTVAHQAQGSCNVTSEESQAVSTRRQQGSRKPRSTQSLSYLWSHTKYVEMFVVVNNQRFQMWGSDVNETVQRVMDIIALANSFTRAINTELVLVGMEIWSEGDLTEVPVDLQVALSNFNRWRQKQLFNRVNYDVAHMIVGHHPGGNTGQAFLGGACSSGFAAAVESFHHEDVLLSAALMVHELGHNLGIRHDHSACLCNDRRSCLMHESISKESGFSNCSSDYFYEFLREHKGACLFNKPRHTGHTRRDATCGNGVLEDPEECDCGFSCASDPCCESTCRLKEDAECSRGLCCFECNFRKAGFNCRPALDECDLPEYCNGTSGECPQDSYKQDGTVCERINYCTGGQCKNPDNQCSAIFGSSARSAPEDCYKSMNTRGDRFGNCGSLIKADQEKYVKCGGDNMFCGKLICTDISILPTIKPQHTLIQFPHEDDWCWSMDAYDGTDIPDDGDVDTGTYCAPNKVCMNHSCTAHTVLNYDCSPAQLCNGKGVCNNLKHCHCEAGFAPPDCKTEGDGGSVDSGPPGKPDDVKPRKTAQKNHSRDDINARRGSKNKVESKSLSNVIYILPLFLIALFLGLIILASLGAGKQPPEAPEKDPEASTPEVQADIREEDLETESE